VPLETDVSGKLLQKEMGFQSLAEMDNDSADVTSEDRSFHVRAVTTGKARLLTVDNLTGGTIGRLELRDVTCHYGITQCYLPSATSERASLNPAIHTYPRTDGTLS